MTETKRWIDRTGDEDRAEAIRQHNAKADAMFSSPAYLAELDERVEAEQAKLQAQTEPVDGLEAALYDREALTPANVRYGSRARRRGMRNTEEDYA